MSLEKYKSQLHMPLRQATDTFLQRDGEVLLAMKKRGFGEGKWNGVGGKPEPGETILDAAVREAEEEIMVTPRNLGHLATLDYYFPEVDLAEDYNQQVVVYTATEWEGEPRETEEMRPQWFAIEDIPYAEMWDDDERWLPKVLQGTFVRAEFMIDANNEVCEYHLLG